MTRQECIALLDRYANYNGMGIPNLAGCREAMKMAVELLSQPSLPSDLDEAVEKHIGDVLFKLSYDDEDGIEQYVDDSFRAGAEWMKAKMMEDGK